MYESITADVHSDELLLISDKKARPVKKWCRYAN